MANKKISQLTTASSVDAGDFFPLAGSVGGGYITEKIDATGVAEYALNPISATQVSGLNKNFFINNTSWDTAAATVTQNPYLQVRQTDGKLVTGSGIGNAVGGDNMGNCQATQTLDMQSNWISGADFSVTGVNDIYFNSASETYGPRIEKDTYDLKVQAGQDLTLSGLRHVSIKGQGLDLADTPISGNVIITGGNVEIDPANKLIVNEIEATGTIGDKASLKLVGALSVTPSSLLDNSTALNWSLSNIQYERINQDTTISFNNVADGQTLTMYVENYHTTNPYTATFSSGDAVVWGSEFSNVAPAVAEKKANVYTFVSINTGIFASAVTGYVY